ncbi:MAG: single-strand selective monofunctional uracil DNA glycosylase [Limisphaerales bacterium]|jgi:single-strand selective monofunctional uracil DNA glycosylase
MSLTKTSKSMIAAARELSDQVDALSFSEPVTHVYNPLNYAWSAHEKFLTRFARKPVRTVLMGMNPGPWGMAQTGVPFGEIAAVRDWMGIECPVGKPPEENPKRPIVGFSCARSEVSGRRLWGLFSERFKTPTDFFKKHFVINYCPLVFMEAGGRNLTPDKLPPAEAAELFRLCDAHLQRVLAILKPDWAVGVGAFALKRIDRVNTNPKIQTGTILHPSPASPAANKDWSGKATAQLEAMGIW